MSIIDVAEFFMPPATKRTAARSCSFLIAPLLIAAALAQAAPTVTLGVTTAGNTWLLYATTSADCAGLSSFDLSFGGFAGMGQVTSASAVAPTFLDTDAADADYNKKAGFATQFTGGNGTISHGKVSDLFQAQMTLYGDANNAGQDWLVLQGVGQAAGTKTSASSGITLGSWGSPALIAQGTFTGPAAFCAVSAFGNVLTGPAGGWQGPGQAQGADFVFQSGGSFPFPSGAGPSLFYGTGDANADGKVSFADYLLLEQNFGKSGATWAMGDFDGDGKVAFADYIWLESRFGKTSVDCPYDSIPVFNYNKFSFSDYLLLERNFGKTGLTWQQGDANDDGKISFADYLIFEAEFGHTTTPEPATMGLLALGAGLLLRRKR